MTGAPEWDTSGERSGRRGPEQCARASHVEQLEHLVTSASSPAVPPLLADVVRSAGRLRAAAAGLDGERLRGPSALPGWTRAHVLAHVARAADAYVRLLDAAATGGGAGRADATALAEAVEKAAALPAGELRADLGGSLDRFAVRARTLSEAAWDVLVTALAGWRHPAWFTLRRCLRELETHHVDLDVGYATSDWPVSYVDWALDDTLGALTAYGFGLSTVAAVDLGRTWTVSPEGPLLTAPGHVLLGWLSGRTPARDLTPAPLPEPPRWPLPPVPGW
ncbi:maleylpyruvate isomerase family mycothiol-dependent enzyme [Streptomyces sp. NPDC006458]|uniref:maleylpyruvate isomerase family mycothiol-dependent enzyme n=1 Tax=Streptomyces sp. NPDC006458 TaxID=3154302 RepID=UPI0033A61BE9